MHSFWLLENSRKNRSKWSDRARWSVKYKAICFPVSSIFFCTWEAVWEILSKRRNYSFLLTEFFFFLSIIHPSYLFIQFHEIKSFGFCMF